MGQNDKKWKLTITQRRKSEYSDNKFDEKVVFINDDILNLTSLIDKLVGIGTDSETTYKIEPIEKEGIADE